MNGTWQTLLSALIGLGVLAVTTLGPRLISYVNHWLEARDKGAVPVAAKGGGGS